MLVNNFLHNENENEKRKNENLDITLTNSELASWVDSKQYIDACASAWVKRKRKQMEADILENAEKKFLQTAVMRDHVQNIMSEGKLPNNYTSPALNTALNNQINTLTTKSPFVFLTINPRPGITFNQLKQSTEKFVIKKWINTYFYVYEIRKAPDHGLHMHMLFHHRQRPYDMKKALHKCFMNICNVNDYNICNIKHVSEDIISDKISYLMGQKKDSKLLGVNATVAWRIKNNIPSYHESSPPFTCRATKPLLLEESGVDITPGTQPGTGCEDVKPLDSKIIN